MMNSGTVPEVITQQVTSTTVFYAQYAFMGAHWWHVFCYLLDTNGSVVLKCPKMDSRPSFEQQEVVPFLTVD